MIVRKSTPADTNVLFELVSQFATSFEPQRDAFEQSAHHLLTDEAVWRSVAESVSTVIDYCLGFVQGNVFPWIEKIWFNRILGG